MDPWWIPGSTWYPPREASQAFDFTPVSGHHGWIPDSASGFRSPPGIHPARSVKRLNLRVFRGMWISRAGSGWIPKVDSGIHPASTRHPPGESRQAFDFKSVFRTSQVDAGVRKWLPESTRHPPRAICQTFEFTCVSGISGGNWQPKVETQKISPVAGDVARFARPHRVDAGKDPPISGKCASRRPCCRGSARTETGRAVFRRTLPIISFR